MESLNSADLYVCNKPVYFKKVAGEYFNQILISETKPVTEEVAAETLRYKLVIYQWFLLNIYLERLV